MSIGVVIVTHYRLGEEFLQALRLIVPEAPTFYAVSVEPTQTVEEMRSGISSALGAADQGEGVLVLTDMFGGTPSNISLSFLHEHHVEVVTGFNLPMLVKVPSIRQHTGPLRDAADHLRETGQRAIQLATQYLDKPRPGSAE